MHEADEYDLRSTDWHVLDAFDSQSDFGFQGLKRKLGIHQETLSTGLTPIGGRSTNRTHNRRLPSYATGIGDSKATNFHVTDARNFGDLPTFRYLHFRFNQ